MMRAVLLTSIFMLGGCVAVQDGTSPAPEAGGGNGQADGELRAPPADARTVEAFDTSSAEDRAKAVADAAPGGGETALGATIASLGAVSEPGIWLKTPLVDTPARGRVEYPEKGTAVAVDLIPLDAEPGSGSRISLAAMRLIEAGLTALPEVRVYRVSE